MNREKTLMYQYLTSKMQFFENDLVQLKNNLHLRNCDMLDHLEFIIAQVKFECLQDVSTEIFALLKE